jgi:hypothetical protein
MGSREIVGAAASEMSAAGGVAAGTEVVVVAAADTEVVVVAGAGAEVVGGEVAAEPTAHGWVLVGSAPTAPGQNPMKRMVNRKPRQRRTAEPASAAPLALISPPSSAAHPVLSRHVAAR